jgi:hypothetical protein
LINILPLCNWLDFEIVNQPQLLEPMGNSCFESLFLAFVSW